MAMKQDKERKVKNRIKEMNLRLFQTHRKHSYSKPAHRSLAQTTIEYAVLIAVFAAAVLAMFQYTKAGIRAKFKFLGDEMRYGMTEDIQADWIQVSKVYDNVYEIFRKGGKGESMCDGRQHDKVSLTQSSKRYLYRTFDEIAMYSEDDPPLSIGYLCARFRIGCCWDFDWPSGWYYLFWGLCGIEDCGGDPRAWNKIEVLQLK